MLKAQWNAPSNIYAFTTQQDPSTTTDIYGNNNLALHVGDDRTKVLAKRDALRQNYNLPSEPAWLEQTHTTDCVIVEEDSNRHADAAITRQKNQVITVMTADCLPILLCDLNGTEIAAIHAGWRGLANGIIENTLNKMHAKNLSAWIGPAICGKCYTIGEEVMQTFINNYPYTQPTFTINNSQIFANLSAMAELILKKAGINNISQSNICTFENADTYYSARKKPITGRIATLIWMT